MRPTQASDRRRPWACLIASGLMSLIGLSVLCAAPILLVLPSGSRRSTATPAAPFGDGVIGGPANAPAETATMTAAPSVAATHPSPTASRTPEPPLPTPDTEGPPAPVVVGPKDNVQLSCVAVITLRWDAPNDPSGISGYRVRLAKYGADFTEEQLFDGLPADQQVLDVSVGCGTSYGWNVLARDGAGNEGVVSDWAYFIIQSADTQGPPAPVVVGPKDNMQLSCVAMITLRWDAPNDPSGISNYRVRLQKRVGNDYQDVKIWDPQVGTQVNANAETDCGQTYRWRLFARDGRGNQGQVSDWAYFVINPPGQ